MIEMKWLQFISFLIIGVVYVTPFSTGSCSDPCSDYLTEGWNGWSGWTGWGGWNNNWNVNWTHGGLQFDPQCPKISRCSEVDSRKMMNCSTTWDCMRTEVCCHNPCAENKQCMKKTGTGQDFNYDQYLSCPVIYSCSKLVTDHVNPRECIDDSECLRKEKCCSHPCDDSAVGDIPEKMCMTANQYYTTQQYQ